jgi:hypothetical protein
MAVKFREPHRCVATEPIFFDVIYQFEAVLAQHCLVFIGIKAGRSQALIGQVAYGTTCSGSLVNLNSAPGAACCAKVTNIFHWS